MNTGTRISRTFGAWRPLSSGLSNAICATLCCVATISLQSGLQAYAAENAPRIFETPQKAVAALVTAAKKKDSEGLLRVLGSQTRQWISSGDAVQDRNGLERFVSAFDNKNRIELVGDNRAVLVIGNDEFPFPFPVIRKAKGWAFDPEQGKEELLNRRIGRNELNTIQVLLAVTDAQREYASVDQNGDGVLEYAMKLRSTPGKRDGLYWPTKEGAPLSPLGPLVADAVREGYGPGKGGAYHGYRFKLLTRQGSSAPGGDQDYVVGGRMIGGFAVLAYPARYGNSGVMSFVVNHEGVTYDADLGPDTEAEAQAIDTFDPGPGWDKVKIN